MNARRIIRSTAQVLGLSTALFAGAAHAVTIDFDTLAPGDVVTTLSGVTFTSNTGLDLIASNRFDADSGDNYLGVDDSALGGNESFLPALGDVVTLQFADPIVSLTASFVSTPASPPDAYTIDTAVGSAVSAPVPDAVLLDGGEVFVVTFASATPFSSADLFSPIVDVHSFNIDTIVFEAAAAQAPGPQTLALLALAAPLMLAGRRRAGRKQPAPRSCARLGERPEPVARTGA